MARVVIDDATNLRPAIERVVANLPERATIRRGERVFLKPNLTYPRHLPGVTTSPHFVQAVVEWLTDLGALVSVGEGDGGYGSWSAEVAFDGHGLREICRRFNARLVNLTTAPARETELLVRGRPYTLGLPAVLLDEVDAFVTLPVPKVHAITRYSGAVKNQWGCIPDPMRLLRHPDFPDLIWAVNRRLSPRLVLGDGQYMLDRNGPLWGDPVYMNRVIGSDDILEFDAAVTRHLMGWNPASVPYLSVGAASGIGSSGRDLQDFSTGPRHAFALRRTVRNRLVAAAFPRQRAVNLIWDSRLGDVAHRLLYAVAGDPVKRERDAVLASARETGSSTHRPGRP